MMPRSAPSASRWPCHPFWELGGFDFGRLSLFHYGHSMRQALQKGDFTTAIPGFASTGSRAEHSQRVCNNVAVQFRAMLYCKDFYPSPVFWERVQLCTVCSHYDGYGNGPEVAQRIATIFVEARKSYLGQGRDRPNGAARLVDEWISFLDAIPRGASPALRPPYTVPWDTRYREWTGMRARGELMDAGQSPGHSLAQRATTTAAGQQSARARPGSMTTSRPNGPVIKREESEDRNIPDDASVIELGCTRPDGFGEGTSGGSKRKGVENFSSHSAKRHADATRTGQVSEMGRYHHLHSPPPSSPLARRRPTVLASSSPAARRSETLFSAPRDGNQSPTTVRRLTQCEDRLADQLKMILEQDLRQSASVSKNATKIERLDSRLRTAKETFSGQRARADNRHEGALGAKVAALEVSVADLDARHKSRRSYIRDEVRRECKETHTTITQTQTRATLRLDGIFTDLGVQKVGLEKCQKAVDDHIDKIKDQKNELESLEGSLKKKARIHKSKIDKLSARVDELEKMKSNKAASDSGSEEDSSTDEEGGQPQGNSHTAGLLTRVEELEKRAKTQEDAATKQKFQREATISKIYQRLQTIERKHSGEKGSRSWGSGAGNPLETRMTDQAEQLAKQERLLDSLTKQLSAVHRHVEKLNAAEKKGRRKSSS